MPMDSLAALFEDTLRDMYYAEKKLTRILPKMAKKATSEELAEAFTSHAEETDRPCRAPREGFRDARQGGSRQEVRGA